MTTAQLIPALLVPILLWRFYRRFRRNVGRQIFRPARMTLFTVLISALVIWLFIAARHRADALLSLTGGVILGAVVAWVGLKLTTFGTDEKGRFYLPNAYLGIVLSLLLAARLVYRFAVLYVHSEGVYSSNFKQSQSPLTLLLVGLTFGYYVIYYSGVLLHFKNRELSEAPAA